MKLLVPRDQLKEAVAGLGRVINPRANLPVLACVRLDADGQSATLTGTDLNQAAAYEIKCDAPASSPVSALIPLETIQSLLKATNGQTVEIEVRKDDVELVGSISGQAISRRVSMPDMEDWPSLPARALSLKPVEPKFMEHVRQAAVFACRDDSRPLLKAVFLDVRDKACHKVVATDSRRLTAFNSVRLPLSESAILPATKFLVWNKLARAPCIGADAGSFSLSIGPWTYTVKTVEGQYPNYRQVVPAYGDALVLELAPEDAELLIKALPSLPAYEGGMDAVVLCLEPNGARVFTRPDAKGPESAIRLEKSAHTGRGSLAVGLNRVFFREALQAGFRCWELRDPTSPLLGRLSKDDKGSIHVLMPIRTIDPEVQRAEASAPAVSVPVPAQPQPIHKETPMPKKKEEFQPAAEPGALDKILAAFESAKTAVRQAQTALSDLAGYVRDAVREDKSRQREIAEVRVTLQKLQAIRV